jgi:hypothetical protein
MATLVVSAAINIAVGFAVNTLFPPEDISQEGPRLTDLGFTGASAGRFINIPFGTVRLDGTIIDTQDPPIEEVISDESTTVGKGGGQQVNTRTYTYFFTGRIAFGIEGANALVKLFGDGKLIYDVSGTGQVSAEGVTVSFYPGGDAQLEDPEELSRRGANETPAYVHLTSVKLDRLPLENFGNRIPNLTAVITYNAQDDLPFLFVDEPASGIDGPASYMMYNPERDELYSFFNSGGTSWVARGTDMVFKTEVDTGGFAASTADFDGFMYAQIGATSGAPIGKIDIDSGALVGQFGLTNSDSTDDLDSFGNSGAWYHLRVTSGLFGVKNFLLHMNALGSANGSIVDADILGALPPGVTSPVIHVLSTADGLASGNLSGTTISDHERGRFLLIQNDSAGNQYRLLEYVPNIVPASGGGFISDDVSIRSVRNFTRGTFAGGDDFEGTGNIQGWALNRVTGDIMLSNSTSTILYNPDTDQILAQKLTGRLVGRNNYFSGNTFAIGTGDTTGGTIEVVDTRDLSTIQLIDVADIAWTGNTVLKDTSLVWDDRSQALYLSRNNTGTTAPVDSLYAKLFIGRITGLGVGLDFIVEKLSTTYNRMEMAGLTTADIDATNLASDTVEGFNINREGSVSSALDPLRKRYFFDAVQSDWKIKFKKRGSASVLTVPEEDVGLLKRGRSQTDEPPILELRTDDRDRDLPMRVNIRYRNKNIDYDVDMEHDKRHRAPSPTMHSNSAMTIDLPIVDTPQPIKQTAQKWLYTLWNERISYKTVIPWTYLKLDPGDVFQMGVFGETARLRLAAVDTGAEWLLGVTGVVEDVKSFSSTIAGSPNLGYNPVTVPSSLPTRIFQLDAPILSSADFTDTFTVSNAYIAISALEDSWRGATVSKSSDNVNYVSVGGTNVEAAVAVVRTAPSAWGYNAEGDFPNRFQEVADGGTMTIVPLRRANAWASAASETLVLSGANAVAVIRQSDNSVEIMNFQNAAVNTDDSIDLTRLLRGRLGTEDAADAGITAGDKLILLSGSTNIKEAQPIIKQSLTLAELNQILFFKGVTIGTLLEDAAANSFTYTGRDIKPYSVVHTTAVNSAGDVVVDWERRTRGPFLGEWLDGTGEVPLNETLEQYEVIITDGVDSLTKTVDDATTVTFTAAELSAGSVSGASTVTVTQISGTGLKSPITSSSTATVTV